MASYVQYTRTRKIVYPVVFKCETCGKHTIALNPFYIQANYNSKGVLTPKGLERREHRADESLRVQEAALFDEIVEATYHKNVKNTGYACACSHCSAVPKWSNFRKPILDKVCQILNYFAVAIIAFLLLAISDGGYTNLNYFLIPVAMLAIANIPAPVLYAHKTSKVKKMDEEYLPILCKDMEEVEEILQKIQTNQKVSIKAPKLATNASLSHTGDAWVCTCGKKNAAYVSSCVCGMTKSAVKMQNSQNK